MHEPVPRFDAVAGLPARRRLVLAIGATLVCGVIAATIAHQHGDAAAPPEEDPRPERPRAAAAAEPGPPASASASASSPPAPAPTDDEIERLRASVDRYLDARAVALRRLDEARRAGVDPDVLSAMGAVLGMPVDRPRSASPPTEASAASGATERAL